MKIQTLLLAGLLVVSQTVVTGQAPAPKPSSDGAGSIRGRITAADTDKPLRRARITIRTVSETAPVPQVTANTNALGEFEAKNVAPGRYLVSASRAGFIPLQYGQRYSRERGLPVEVRKDQTLDQIDIALPRGSVLSGQITDELGEPYPGVRVDALDLRYDEGKRVPFPIVSSTTDDQGQFRLSGLQPGTYYVVATSNETWRNEKKQSLGYASTYFPGVAANQAQAITLAQSQQRTDVNFTLSVSRTVRVAGRVLQPSGEPQGNSPVSLMYSYAGGAVMSVGGRSVRTGADGTFEFRDVPPAQYYLSTSGASTNIVVSGADVTDLVLAQRLGSTVVGSLVAEDGAPPPFQVSGVRVILQNASDQVLPTVYVNAVNADWSFKLTNLAGPFMFRLRGLPDDWALSAVRLNDKDITDTPWDVPSGGQTLTGMKIVVTQKVGQVSGIVVDDSGKPSSAGTVVVFSDDAEYWMPGSRFIRAMRPANDGRFSMVGLPAGTYRAIARPFIEDGQWEDRTFLEEARDGAASFVLIEGTPVTITLKLPSVK